MACICTFGSWSLWHYMYFYLTNSLSMINHVSFLVGLLGSCFILGAIYKISKSLWLCVLYHCILNVLSQTLIANSLKMVIICNSICIILSILIVRNYKMHVSSSLGYYSFREKGHIIAGGQNLTSSSYKPHQIQYTKGIKMRSDSINPPVSHESSHACVCVPPMFAKYVTSALRRGNIPFKFYPWRVVRKGISMVSTYHPHWTIVRSQSLKSGRIYHNDSKKLVELLRYAANFILVSFFISK